MFVDPDFYRIIGNYYPSIFMGKKDNRTKEVAIVVAVIWCLIHVY